mmetsp:Transcript_54624/g.128259  ORF Transcript_54624/g.128259 Transcript_54624/m.128259 type:complete len:226 (+) Transcript_54624:2749-3426(+)
MLLPGCHMENVGWISDELRGVGGHHGSGAQLPFGTVAPGVHQGVRSHDEAVLVAHGHTSDGPIPDSSLQRHCEPAVPTFVYCLHGPIIFHHHFQLGSITHRCDLLAAPKPQVLVGHATWRNLSCSCQNRRAPGAAAHPGGPPCCFAILALGGLDGLVILGCPALQLEIWRIQHGRQREVHHAAVVIPEGQAALGARAKAKDVAFLHENHCVQRASCDLVNGITRL